MSVALARPSLVLSERSTCLLRGSHNDSLGVGSYIDTPLLTDDLLQAFCKLRV
jgi:hypothetical protein